MGKKTRGAVLRAKKRGDAAQLDLVAETAHQVETQHVTEKSDDALFVLDTTAAAVVVKTETSKKKHVKSEREQEQIQALLEKHDAKTLEALAKPRKRKAATATFDLWDEEPVSKQPKAQKAVAGVAPPRVVTKALPAPRKQKHSMVAVDVAQSGQSYHPDPQQHQDVIGEALALELRRKEAVEYRNAPISTGLSEETKAVMMGDDDSSSSEDEGDEQEQVVVKRKTKLTRAQRNRQKRIRAEEREVQERKLTKKRLNAIGEVKKLKKELEKQQLERKERKVQIAALKQEQYRVLGKGVLQHASQKDPIGAPALPVALTDELRSSLRTLKPKGSLLTDRMESFRDRKMAASKHVGDRKRIIQGNKRRKLKVKAKGHDVNVTDEQGQDYLLMG